MLNCHPLSWHQVIEFSDIAGRSHRQRNNLGPKRYSFFGMRLDSRMKRAWILQRTAMADAGQNHQPGIRDQARQ